MLLDATFHLFHNYSDDTFQLLPSRTAHILNPNTMQHTLARTQVGHALEQGSVSSGQRANGIPVRRQESTLLFRRLQACLSCFPR